MNKRKLILSIIGLLLAACGLTAVLITRADAIAEGAAASDKAIFAVGLIAAVVVSLLTPAPSEAICKEFDEVKAGI